MRWCGRDSHGGEVCVLFEDGGIALIAVGHPALRDEEIAAGVGSRSDRGCGFIIRGGVAHVNRLCVRRNRKLAGFHVALILQPDVHTAVAIGSDRDKNDEPATREHPASRFFPALREERLPVEFEGRLHIARCEIEKERHLGRLEGLRTVHERERREIQDLCRLFHCRRRFDRIGGSRVIGRLVFRSASEEATNYTRRKDFSHHGPTVEAKNFVHTRAMLLK